MKSFLESKKQLPSTEADTENRT